MRRAAPPVSGSRFYCAGRSLKLVSRLGRKYGAAKLGNPFSTNKITEKKKRPSCRRIQRSLYVSRGFRSVGATTSISSGVHWAGRGRSQNHTYLDWCELRSPATIEVPVRRFFTGCGGGTPSRLPEPPRHSRMRLTARQNTPAIDAAIYRPNSPSYQLQPSFHTQSTEPEPTARARRAGKEFY